MIYNFNLGIGWASSGVEYAQSYRANMLRNINAPAKFVFMDMFQRDNIQAMTENIGFKDEEIIWLYTFFTDTHISPVTFTLEDLEKTIADKNYSFSRDNAVCRYIFEGDGNFYTVYMTDDNSDKVHRVEIVSRGCLIRKDYYTYTKIFSEYYAPFDKKAHLYARRFFNEDGSVAYEEMNDDDNVLYKFPDALIGCKEELVGYMVSKLNLTADDTVIIDRTTGIGQSIIQNAGPAKIGVVIHADHFSESATDDDNILWNNYYEYSFSQYKNVDFYICATDAQNKLVREQFEHYMGVTPNVVTIPVGSLNKLITPENGRRPHSLITASRLAVEKHVDWIVEAVSLAQKEIPDITLDIFGKGGEEEKLKKLITGYGLENSVRLMGQHNLENIYKDYEAYVSGSLSEGFGLTLMEAVGSGLPIIGFDVRYGNQTFIDDGQNGYCIPVNDKMDGKAKAKLLADAIVKLFKEADIDSFHAHSYKKAEQFLTCEVEKRWEKLTKQTM